MIIKKPYAFMIKHFRTIHVILTILVMYLISKTHAIFTFFNDYANNNGYLINKDKILEKESSKIGVVIGPEGGIDKQEIDELKLCGAKIITLGSRILRTETAPIAITSNIMYEFEF